MVDSTQAVKISDLSAIGGSLSDDDIIPIVDAGTNTTQSVRVDNLTGYVANTLNLNTDQVPEGLTNKYYSDAQVQSLVDSAYVQARQILGGSGIDSSTLQPMIDSSIASLDLFDSADAIKAVTSADLDMAGNKVLFANVYANEVDLPNASTYHGMFAHVHATGAAYYAHAGNWVKIANSSDITSSSWDSATTVLVINETVDSAYVRARQFFSSFDSDEVQDMIDSAVASIPAVGLDSTAIQPMIDSSIAGIETGYATTVGYNPADTSDSSSYVLRTYDAVTPATFRGDVIDNSGNVIVDVSSAYFSGTVLGSVAGNVTTPDGSTVVLDPDNSILTITDITANGTVDFSSATVLGTHDSVLTQQQIDSSISASSGNPFDQDLNTTDDVEFNRVASNLDGAVIFKAKNESGSPIAKGEAVYISGVSGNTPLVDVADASDSDKMPAFGIAMETASDNSEIEIVTFGDLAGVDTQSYAVGDTLFVGTTPGQITNVKPTGASTKIQNIAYVTKVDNTTGRIKVGGAGRSAATPNLDPGQIFYGNGSGRSTPTLMTDVVDSAYVQARVTLDGMDASPTNGSTDDF